MFVKCQPGRSTNPVAAQLLDHALVGLERERPRQVVEREEAGVHRVVARAQRAAHAVAREPDPCVVPTAVVKGRVGIEDAVELDHLLTLVSVYWFEQGGAGAANFLYEAMHAEAAWGQTHDRPQGFVAFGIQDLPPFPASAALLGMAAAVGVGALAGLLPALVAVRVKVIDAIRF